MDIRDFQGLTKFKIILPIFYICGWICMILGPIFFDVVYQRICVFVLLYSDLKVVIMLFTMFYVTFKSSKLLKRIKEQRPPGDASIRGCLDIAEGINYGFILPNYKEDILLISQTLDVLASHKRAK
jgi:hypothetical protein